MPQPVEPRERIEVLDALRGFAVLGILLVNIDLHSSHFLDALRAQGGPLDRAAAFFVDAFAEGKFFPLFSFLFGFGLAIQGDRAAARGAPFLWTWLRRQLALLVIGLGHALLIWPGDILAIYAVAGTVLLAFRALPPRMLPPIAVFLWLAGLTFWTAILAALGLVFSVLPNPLDPSEVLAEAGRANAAYLSGDLVRTTIQRAKDYLQMLFGVLPAGTVIFSMHLLGLWAGRTGVLHERERHDALLRWVGIGGASFALPIALGGAIAASRVEDPTLPTGWAAVAFFAMALGGPVLALAYAALFVRHAGPRLVGLLAPVGRMALTNYLAQSVVCAFVFQGWGLGFYGSTTNTVELAFSIALFVVQIAWSRAWLARFRFGPAEWAWRAVTYGTVPPMRVPPVTAASA